MPSTTSSSFRRLAASRGRSRNAQSRKSQPASATRKPVPRGIERPSPPKSVGYRWHHGKTGFRGFGACAPGPTAAVSAAPAPPVAVRPPERPLPLTTTKEPMARKNVAATPAQTLQILAEKVKACTRCDELARTRKQTVFGVGNPQAKILFIGEAAGSRRRRPGRTLRR